DMPRIRVQNFSPLCLAAIMALCAIGVNAQDFGTIDTVLRLPGNQPLLHVKAFGDTVYYLTAGEDDRVSYVMSTDAGETWAEVAERRGYSRSIPGVGTCLTGYYPYVEKGVTLTDIWVMHAGKIVYETTDTLSKTPASQAIKSFVVNPLDEHVLFITREVTGIVADVNADVNWVYYSVDNGRTWTEIVPPPPTSGYGRLMKVRFDYSDAKSWVFEVQGQNKRDPEDTPPAFYRTTDSGKTLTRFYGPKRPYTDWLGDLLGLNGPGTQMTVDSYNQMPMEPIVTNANDSTQLALNWIENIRKALIPPMDSSRIRTRLGFSTSNFFTNATHDGQDGKGFSFNVANANQFCVTVAWDTIDIAGERITRGATVATSDKGATWGWVTNPKFYGTTLQPYIDQKNGTIYVSTDVNDCCAQGQPKYLLRCRASTTSVSEDRNIVPGVRVYPVPSSATITIEIHSSGHIPGDIPIQVFDTYGRCVVVPKCTAAGTAEAYTLTFDVSSLPSGVYTALVDNNDDSIRIRFLVSK
ncbi:MAG: T9SS type A sorting domain-containing protein, partial [Candidatus Kapabacteria bacterium]|nr:T9SS type A sorting domain-containing protein [Candidatus Kapabacteria bacterium]